MSMSAKAKQLLKIYEEKGWNNSEFFGLLDNFISFLCSKYGCPPERLEETKQECSIRLMSAMDKFDTSKNFLTFIYTVIKNEIFCQNKKHRYYQSHVVIHSSLYDSDKNYVENLVDDGGINKVCDDIIFSQEINNFSCLSFSQEALFFLNVEFAKRKSSLLYRDYLYSKFSAF